jgi:hypothetical protein
VLLTLLAWDASAVGRARAQDDPDARWDERALSIEAHFGFGTPVGLGGLMLAYSPWPWIAAYGGAGVSTALDGTSLQLAVGGLVRLPFFRRARMFVSADYSTGAWLAPDLAALPQHDDTMLKAYSERMHWLNVNLGLEWRLEMGLLVKLYFGVGAMLNPGSRRCLSIERSGRRTDCTQLPDFFGDPSIPIVGGALGYAF